MADRIQGNGDTVLGLRSIDGSNDLGTGMIRTTIIAVITTLARRMAVLATLAPP